MDQLTCYACCREDKDGTVRFTAKNSNLLICVTCNDRLCCGLGSISNPVLHSRAHALKKKHWFAVLYCDLGKGYCFKCETEVGLQEIHDDSQAYAIRGLPNLGNTCYMSAVLQCLFVLGKLQERMLALDHPESSLAKALKKLFVEPIASGDKLNLNEVLKCVNKQASQFKVGFMQDSHDLLTALRELWNKDDAKVIDSIFGIVMLQTLSCKKCGTSRQPQFELDLKLDFPPKWHPTKSAASPQTSESPRSQKREIPVQLFPADVQRNLEKMQTVSESGHSRVDSTQAQHIGQSKDVVQSPLQIQEGKSVDSLAEDLISIEDFLSLFCKEEVECSKCAKNPKEPSDDQNKDREQIVPRIMKTLHFTTLPPVLTLHINRTSHSDVGIKINDHVRFMECLDVKQFVEPSSVNKGSTRYRLAGVVEHIGEGSLFLGHYIAYVRAKRPGNEQDGSGCSSSWFCADDLKIRQVDLKEVLSCKAYILFYERMEEEDQDWHKTSEVKNAVTEQADE